MISLQPVHNKYIVTLSNSGSVVYNFSSGALKFLFKGWKCPLIDRSYHVSSAMALPADLEADLNDVMQARTCDVPSWAKEDMSKAKQRREISYQLCNVTLTFFTRFFDTH